MYTDGSYADARRMARMSNSGIGPDTYRAELADAADEMAANVAAQNYVAAGQARYENMLRQNQLQQQYLDQQTQINQQNILAQEQARRNAETQQRYAYLNQQSANQLAGQRSMMQGIQGMLGGQGGLLGGLLAGQGQASGKTQLNGADGKPIGGGSFRTNSPLSSLSSKPFSFG